MARRKPSTINALIGVDKPVGCTSHDVVARVRKALGERRVGHAGTLDPLASGVMVVGIGQATRLLGMLTLDTKSYVAEIEFGCETDTDDAEGAVVRTAPVDGRLLDLSYAAGEIAALVGVSKQVPPAYSAISVDGVRSYARARSGDVVELPERDIEILEASLIGVDSPNGPDRPVWTCAFTVSKGTYIRAIARDLGRSLGSAAHIRGLRRTSSGRIGISRCVPVDEVSMDALGRCMIDPIEALGLCGIRLPESSLEDVLCGRRVPVRLARGLADGAAPELSDGERVAIAIGSELRAISVADGGLLCMKHVFPQGIGGVCYDA